MDPGSGRRAQEEARILLCAHVKELGNRSIGATMERLQRYVVGSSVEDDAKEMARHCCLMLTLGREDRLVPYPLDATRCTGLKLCRCSFSRYVPW